jgi:single-stranded-DNA-specific exonuclease
MKKIWRQMNPDPSVVEGIQTHLGCSPVMAAVLANRGIFSAGAARAFMDYSLSSLRPPFAIRDMDAAVDRITTAVLNREKILIFGDYDVDGITATALLLEFLQSAGADVSYYIPHRTREGYDLQTDHILRVALPLGVDLLITVDCGSGRHDAVMAAQKSGIDVVITDHHTIGSPPPASAVVNPRRQDCGAGFEHLSGAGVAFALIISLRKHLRSIQFWQDRPEPNLKNYCDLVALGTVADMVPLVQENRILSRIGLEVINRGRRTGLTALIRSSGIKGDADMDDISFRLAPRLNAAGRLGHAKTAVELLTAKDPRYAEEISLKLNAMNKLRQDTEKQMLEKILAGLEKHPDHLKKNSLVLSHSEWHEGVIGVAAAKLTEKFFRPVILISEKNSMGKGSGRSIPGINIYDALGSCREHLDRFGGHPMAAGLRIQRDRIDAFREAFEQAVSRMSSPETFSRVVPIDYELNFDQIRGGLIDEMESLMPFGEGNPEPLFLARDVRVVSSWIVGRHHRKMGLCQGTDKNGAVIGAIHFNADTASLRDSYEQIAFRLRWNRWNGCKAPQIIIEEI